MTTANKAYLTTYIGIELAGTVPLIPRWRKLLKDSQPKMFTGFNAGARAKAHERKVEDERHMLIGYSVITTATAFVTAIAVKQVVKHLTK